MSAPSEITSGVVSDAPKVLGVSMLERAGGWSVAFGAIRVRIGAPRDRDGLRVASVNGNFVSVNPSEELRAQTLGECLVAIERELLAIRAAIPERETP